ncbi:family 43 glycosylhydrolase [Arthrobacter sp. NPDC056691]|uniref:family 43 glycosylhydrolase n=1 Tax=Arthrobacter sp. NPDC056691 TaxID=3345913 RepID=UPI00366F8C06
MQRRRTIGRAVCLATAAAFLAGAAATGTVPASATAAAAPATAQEKNMYSAIPNGQPYLDADGNPIDAHGGFTLKHGGVYYWVGEDKSHNRATFKGVNMYKSTDLENWEYVGAALSPETLDTNGNKVLAHCKVERPKLLYNEATKKFVLWGHYEMFDGYAASEVVVATADKIEGPYTVTAKGHFRPGAGNADGVGAVVGETQPNGTPAKADYPATVASGAAVKNLSEVSFDTTLKAISVVMKDGYPTEQQSPVATAEYNIGASRAAELKAPVIGPAQPTGGGAVVVNPNGEDNAFITPPAPDATVYYTTDGTEPDPAASAAYTPGTPIRLDKAKTVKAIAVRGAEKSPVTTAGYRLAAAGEEVPVYPPVISVPGGSYPDPISQVRLYATSSGTTIHYTQDGKDPDPLLTGENMGFGSRDYTLYQDPVTGKAYLVTAQDHIYLRVWQLTADYTDVIPTTQYPMFVGQSREAPALIREGGYTYMITSKQSGWYPNQAMYTRTTDISDPSKWEDQKPVGDNTTFHSQPTQILDIGKNGKHQYVYLGDRWNPQALVQSNYVWLPLAITNGQMSLSYVPELDINLSAGKIKAPNTRLLSLGKPATSSGVTSEVQTATQRYGADVANDGVSHDLDPWDSVSEYYKSDKVPFSWTVDLEQPYDLHRIDISARTVGGSDAAHRYAVSVSNDGVTWTEAVDNRQNNLVGFKSHALSGTYRYVKVDVFDVWDVVHNQRATWARGLQEVSVYGLPTGG